MSYGTPLDPEKESRDSYRDVLNKYLGVFCGDVYATALEMFSEFSLLERTGIYINPDLSIIVGGINEDGEPSIHIGAKDKVITAGLKRRIIRRFGLPPGLLEIAPQGLFLPFVLAHEIAHVMQEDPQFPAKFGEIDRTVYKPEEDYSKYVEVIVK